ncbi:hypothetical protein F383_35100 [Gossypium arboreum]|uniref:Uncharacterized protein n=1 Tax=Gossypium arboreum TaxID=29729 RepID=A0A0B0N0Z9_GOSAR|nr:hypothetical protein F383_35100 [Gossypium arboreum]
MDRPNYHQVTQVIISSTHSHKPYILRQDYQSRLNPRI